MNNFALRAGSEDYEGSDEEKDDSDDDLEDINCFDIEEDIYGMCITSLVIDLQTLYKGTGSRAPNLRKGRIVLTFGLLVGCIALQAWLLHCVKHFVSAVAVKDIQTSYKKYENVMRASGQFDEAAFHNLSAEDMDIICQIPFSQPYFFMTILSVWTISILAEIKDVGFMGRCTVGLPTSADYTALTKKGEEGHVIMQLPRRLKAFIFVFVLLPRVAIAGRLLYLGCRWLSATPNFSDLLLNAVALEFIAQLRVLMYDRLTPARGKRDLRNMKFLAMESDVPTLCNLLGAYGWIIFVFLFVFVYVYHLQQVLPNYNWDVQEVCSTFIAERSDLR
jgi:hypothetical protein